MQTLTYVDDAISTLLVLCVSSLNTEGAHWQLQSQIWPTGLFYLAYKIICDAKLKKWKVSHKSTDFQILQKKERN